MGRYVQPCSCNNHGAVLRSVAGMEDLADGSAAFDANSEPRHGRPRANVLRAIFGAVQIALALMLVTGAGLFHRSFAILQKADLGFQPASVLSFLLPLPRE